PRRILRARRPRLPAQPPIPGRIPMTEETSPPRPPFTAVVPRPDIADDSLGFGSADLPVGFPEQAEGARQDSPEDRSVADTVTPGRFDETAGPVASIQTEDAITDGTRGDSSSEPQNLVDNRANSGSVYGDYTPIGTFAANAGVNIGVAGLVADK